mgnify:CR=1 FL=1
MILNANENIQTTVEVKKRSKTIKWTLISLYIIKHATDTLMFRLILPVHTLNVYMKRV